MESIYEHVNFCVQAMIAGIIEANKGSDSPRAIADCMSAMIGGLAFIISTTYETDPDETFDQLRHFVVKICMSGSPELGKPWPHDVN